MGRVKMIIFFFEYIFYHKVWVYLIIHMCHISLKVKQVTYSVHLLLLDLSQVALGINTHFVLLDLSVQTLLLPHHVSNLSFQFLNMIFVLNNLFL